MKPAAIALLGTLAITGCNKSESFTHEVKEGETFSEIVNDLCPNGQDALARGVTEFKIMEKNGMANDQVSTGAELKLSPEDCVKG